MYDPDQLIKLFQHSCYASLYTVYDMDSFEPYAAS